ncbi:TfuA-like protein [Archangium violaceum]|uniref:TfuA-like core domain-containing protein n=1 Tax=Archangium violaceum Cb vi76 TaxID=1406225 RepID=A0A084T053_9BACT|nr:TfuA-like protein [Archangium violaceum]KFA94088.1 hypothetical protein Q664_04760 [Archangium violaceum Cb vi76]
MSIYIFTGPSLSPEEGRAEFDAVFLPPAAQGDVYRASLDQPRAIGIIDGYFERIPSVWHKEILWAISQGIHVFGSASMGALRAAELAAFGMEGVGTIYEAFASGALQDDDEVAVLHGAAEDGYRTVSEAMVNIRATLEAAVKAGVLGPETHTRLERLAKELFYPERSWPVVLARGAEQKLPAGELEALRSWLPRGRVNQKRVDALAMLRVMRERLSGSREPKRVRYSFEYTDAWDQVRRRTGQLRTSAGTNEAVPTEALVEELRVGGTHERARQGALLRVLALEEARRQGLAVSSETLQGTVDAFRRERELFDPADTERWMATQGLGLEDFTRLMRDEAQVRRMALLFEPEVTRSLPDHLRTTGEYARLIPRAWEKQRLLAANGLEAPSLADAGLTAEALWQWYFGERLGRPMPDEVDAFARSSGFADAEELRRAVLREWCFLRLTAPDPRT